MDTIKKFLEVAMHLRLSILFVLLLSSCGGGSAGNPGTQIGGGSWGVITASIAPGVDSSSSSSSSTTTLAARGRDVDIFQTANCSTSPTTPVPEPFTDHDSIVTLTLSAANPKEPVQNYIVEGYRIDYTTETPGAPPIASFTSGSQSMILEQDKSLTQQVVMVDISRKLKLAQDLTSGQYQPAATYPTYTAIYTFYGHDIYGNAFQTVVQTNFEVGDFNYCPAGA
ncbi:MAG: hypothetical protein ACHQ0Y_14530 [Thermodesulfovibrionales bacterium]